MGAIEKKPRELVKITDTLWVTKKKHAKILASEERAKDDKPERKISLEKDKVTPKGVAEYVAKTAEDVIKFNPTALVAIHKRGVLATRLIQHYIKRKTGKKHKVYIVKPGKKRISCF